MRIAPLFLMVIGLVFATSQTAQAAPAPTVTALSPITGTTAGGTIVTVTGTDFTGATIVKFGTTSAGFMTNGPTSITATAPAGVAGPVNVTVTTADGTSAAAAANVYTYVAPAPVVSGVSPAAGPPAGGTSVVLTGTSFTGTTAVKFGAVSATFLFNSDTQITATAPAGALGPVNVFVTTASGTSTATAANVYTYAVPGPVVTGLSPATGPVAGGTTVIITGTGFTGATAVKFGTANATGSVINSDAQITSVAPAGAAGMVNVTVTGPNGTSPTAAANQYTYTGPGLAVTGVSPSSGPLGGGTVVIITGSGFTGATAVTFGGVGAAYAVNSDTQITATAPPSSSAAIVNVQVTTPAANSAISVNNRFTYMAPGPVVAGLSPSSGNVGGGTAVVITGSGFTGTTSVTFGGLTASFSVNSDTQITAVTPAHSAGSAVVIVATLTGTSTASAAATFHYTGTVGPPMCPEPVLWTNDLAYGSIGGGFWWDSVSGQVWTGQRGWHLFAPQPPRPFPLPLWVNALGYGSIGGGFWWDPVSGQVWTGERGWHLYSPQGCVR